MLHSKSEDGHALIIDAGEKMYHLNFNQKFVLETFFNDKSEGFKILV